MIEIFKDIKDYEGLYQISNLGRIKSFCRRTPKIIKNQKSGPGYPYITLCREASKKSIFIHRLIAETFINNPKNKQEVNHKNGVKTDYSIENLEWVTPSENQSHAFKTGLSKNTFIAIKKANRKFNDSQIKEIRELYKKGFCVSKIAKLFNEAIDIISKICRNKTYVGVA